MVNKAITVETNIPAPRARKRGNHGKYPWAGMEVGDSFFVPNRDTKHMSACASYHARVAGQQFTVAEATENGVTGARVWRIG